MKFKIGQEYTYERTFTKKDVEEFIVLSQYTGKHHEVPNEDGEVMIQGLLTATLPTTIGGQYDILMYKMVYHLVKPVYTGDHVVCRITVKDLFEKNGTERIILEFSTKNQKGEEVLSGELKGLPLDL
ncbi:MAG: enoyl-CoA hydratase [Tissierellia bacterium]|nr:enoyl-CoA hydratase [Tissierellia bacterium]